MIHVDRGHAKCAPYLSYAPNPSSALERESKEAMRRIKNDSVRPGSDLKTTSYIAQSIARSSTGYFDSIFKDGSAAMVPAPKSSLIGKGDLWVPHNMAASLVEHGLGASIVPCLKRVKPVQKAAFSKASDRPQVATHLESMAVEAIEVLDKVILVDDVVTSGAMLMGAAEKLRSAFPGVEIAAFAAMRTISSGKIEKIIDPKVETITLYSSGKTHRE